MYRWPEAQETKLLKLLNQDYSYQEIGRELNKTPRAIEAKVNRLIIEGKKIQEWGQVEKDFLYHLEQSTIPSLITKLYQAEAKKLGWPKRTKKEIENELTLVEAVVFPWTNEEETELRSVAGKEHSSVINIHEEWISICEEKSWPLRTKQAIEFKLRRLDETGDLEQKGQFITIPSLAEAIGVSESTIRVWIRDKMLKTYAGARTRTIYIHYKALVRFTFNNPIIISQKVSEDGVWWLLSLMKEYCSIRNRPC